MSENNKALAAIGYIPPLFFIPLFLAADDPLAKYHGRQALVIFVAAIITLFVFWLLRFLFQWFAPLEYLFILVEGLLFAFYIITSIIAAVNAAKGKSWRIPILGAYSDRLNI